MLPRPHYLDRTPPVARERWLVSYTDVITILMILFVAVAARGVQRQTPPKRVDPIRSPSALEKAKDVLERAGLHPRLEARGLVISLPQAILYASGDDEISEAARPTICEIAGVLSKMPNHIVLAGYADTRPIHNQRFRNNWELSAARALSLLQLLTDQYGVEESRLSIASYGSHDPKTPNNTVEGRAGNRRVEIVIQGS